MIRYPLPADVPFSEEYDAMEDDFEVPDSIGMMGSRSVAADPGLARGIVSGILIMLCAGLCAVMTVAAASLAFGEEAPLVFDTGPAPKISVQVLGDGRVLIDWSLVEEGAKSTSPDRDTAIYQVLLAVRDGIWQPMTNR